MPGLLRDRSKKQLLKLRKQIKSDIGDKTSKSSRVRNAYKVDDHPEKADTYETRFKDISKSKTYSQTFGYTKTFDSFINDIYPKLNESGEWESGVDWEYVKNNPDDDGECASWIKSLADKLEEIEIELTAEGSVTFSISNIKGFDMYQGPCADVRINGKSYKVWTMENNKLWIEEYPADNTGGDKSKSGLQGFTGDLSNIIIETEKDLKIFKTFDKMNNLEKILSIDLEKGFRYILYELNSKYKFSVNIEYYKKIFNKLLEFKEKFKPNLTITDVFGDDIIEKIKEKLNM